MNSNHRYGFPLSTGSHPLRFFVINFLVLVMLNITITISFVKIFFVSLFGRPWTAWYIVIILIASYAVKSEYAFGKHTPNTAKMFSDMLIATVFFSIATKSTIIAGCGTILNCIAVTANGMKMPVLVDSADPHLKDMMLVIENSKSRHKLFDENTRLWLLTDILFGLSIGDILIEFGLLCYIFS